MESLSGYQIISIVGRQGAGKSTIGSLLAKQLDAIHVEASDVVRKLRGDLPRSDMPFTNELTKDDPGWLGRAIAAEVLNPFKESRFEHIGVITGVREDEVHETFRYLGAKAQIIALYADPEVRYERLLGKKCFNYKQFMEHENNERMIGLDLLLFRDYPTFHTSDSTKPEDVVANISELLDNAKVIK